MIQAIEHEVILDSSVIFCIWSPSPVYSTCKMTSSHRYFCPLIQPPVIFISVLGYYNSLTTGLPASTVAHDSPVLTQQISGLSNPCRTGICRIPAQTLTAFPSHSDEKQMSLRWLTCPTLLHFLCLLLTLIKPCRLPCYSSNTTRLLNLIFSLIRVIFSKKITCPSPWTPSYLCKSITFSGRQPLTLLKLHTPMFTSLPLYASSFSRTIWHKMTYNIFFLLCNLCPHDSAGFTKEGIICSDYSCSFNS